MKAVISYIWILFVILGITVIANVEYGLTMLQVFIFGGIFSFIWKYFTKANVLVDVSFSHSEIEKEEIITATIKVANQSVFPTSFVDIYLICPPQCEIEDSPVIRTTLAGKQVQKITCKYRGKIRGVAKIGVQKVILKSFFGWFNTLVVNEEKAKYLQTEVIIMPKIFQIDLDSDLFRMQTADDEEGEDEQNCKVTFFGGQPGYEFRDYRPGDTLSRVNWKLTAKRDKLTVRENVLYISNNQLLCLSPYATENLTLQERLLESILSVAFAMMNNDRPVQVLFYEKDEWVLLTIENKAQFDALKVKFAQYTFAVNGQGIHFIENASFAVHDHVRSKYSIFLFSAVLNDDCYTLLSKTVRNNTDIHQILVDDTGYIPFRNSLDHSVWLIDSQNEIRCIS